MRTLVLVFVLATACGAPDLAATQQPTTPHVRCAGAIDPAQAAAIAEQRVGGTAIANIADDDDPCAREIQVQTKDTLMEVKVASDGRVLEVEVSDEGSGTADDEDDDDDDDDDRR